MRYLEQKPGPLWWTKNVRVFIYFVRELSGIIIGFCAFILIMAFLFAIVFPRQTNLALVLTFLGWLALVSSLVHTFTWLEAMTRILPLRLSATGQKIACVILIFIWLGLSFLFLNTIYQQQTYG